MQLLPRSATYNTPPSAVATTSYGWLNCALPPPHKHTPRAVAITVVVVWVGGLPPCSPRKWVFLDVSHTRNCVFIALKGALTPSMRRRVGDA